MTGNSVSLQGGSGDVVFEATAGTFTSGQTGCGGSRAVVTGSASVTFSPPADGAYTITAAYASAEGAVSIVTNSILTNGDFSADTIPTAPGYVYMNPAGWEDSTGGIVVVRNGNGPWGGLDSGGGANFISIQGSGATLRQTLTGLTAGQTYIVNFLVTHRPGYGNDETLHVNVDGTPIWETRTPAVRANDPIQ
jgi:hypothetical protein